MKTAIFTNFTDEDFIGYWDGKGKRIPAHQSLMMPDYLAEHFAKHLANRELLRTNDKKELLIKNGDKYTSPKKPNEVPEFMKLFNKAYKPSDDEDMSDEEVEINIANAGKENGSSKGNKSENSNEPQVVLLPDLEDDDYNEDSFEENPNIIQSSDKS